MAVRSDIPVEVKQEITAAARLSSRLGGQRTSVNQIAARFNLSQPGQAAIVKGLKKPALADEMFVFDAKEFKALVAFKSVELDNGATLTAESDRFEKVFRKDLRRPEIWSVQWRLWAVSHNLNWEGIDLRKLLAHQLGKPIEEIARGWHNRARSVS